MGSFPPAYRAPGFNPGFGWSSFLLPYVEQDGLYRLLDPEKAPFGAPPFTTPAQVPLGKTRLSIFRCPSDLGPDENHLRLFFATSNYRAVAGPITYPFFFVDQDMGGVMYQNSKIRLTDITDGTSQTLAVGECILDEKLAKRACIWVGMTGLRDGAIWISDVMWWVDEATARVNGTAPQAFSSRHTGGAYFGFCDGSVRFFRDNTDPNTVRWLAGRNDGRVVNVDI